MKAYFIGGPLDLTCMSVRDDPEPVMHAAARKPLVLSGFGPQGSEKAMVEVETVVYRLRARSFTWCLYVEESRL